MSHPAPLVPARPAEPDEIPRTARTLITKATAAGWTATARYAHGTTLPGRGQEAGKLVESVVVRLEHDQAAATIVAVWVEGKFDVAFRWARWLELEMVGVRGLPAWALAVSQLAESGLEFGEVPA